ncbi:hypothetical protein C8R44DRAFT_729090 [Mycena epipterygia]|nr:hypothetical protein C8R44DRAFT_729090 [Mycena epipterygia]
MIVPAQYFLVYGFNSTVRHVSESKVAKKPSDLVTGNLYGSAVCNLNIGITFSCLIGARKETVGSAKPPEGEPDPEILVPDGLEVQGRLVGTHFLLPLRQRSAGHLAATGHDARGQAWLVKSALGACVWVAHRFGLLDVERRRTRWCLGAPTCGLVIAEAHRLPVHRRHHFAMLSRSLSSRLHRPAAFLVEYFRSPDTLSATD